MGREYVEPPTPFSHEFAPQELEELELEEVEVVDDDESSVPVGGVRSTMRPGTAISIKLPIIPTASGCGIRGPSLTTFTASWCSILTILAR